MNLFNAAIFTNDFGVAGRQHAKLPEALQRLREKHHIYLDSYHYIGKPKYVKAIRAEGRKVFLDSGAYSAFSQGAQIDIGKYCDYIHTNSDIILFPSVLDAIGDHLGTYRNQEIMESRGIRALPCYHYGEPIEVGQHYADNYDYMALGGLVPVSTKQMRIWLDEVFERVVCDGSGKPRVKVHGFGVTSLELMLRYPWESVDSTSWLMSANNGSILLPDRGKMLSVSSKASQRKVLGQHLDTLAPVERFAIETEIAQYGVDPDDLRGDVYSRWAWNAWAFPEYLRQRWEDKPFFREQQGLL